MRWSKRKVAEHGYLVENVWFSESDLGESVGKGVCPVTGAGEIDGGTGHNRIRNLGRRARGYRHTRDHGVPPEVARTLERHSRWYQRPITKLVGEQGQATVEFAVIAAGFLAATAALMALWRTLGDGLLVEHAVAVASHHVQAVAPATIVDIFLY